MERLPLELHRSIYGYACMDEGTTGRSLGLVSRYIRHASADFRYQSICLDDSAQIARFRKLADSYHAWCGRPMIVKHLYVCIGSIRRLMQPGRASYSRTEGEPNLVPLLREVGHSLETLSIVLPAIYPHLGADMLEQHDMHGRMVAFPKLIELTVCGRITLPFNPAFAPNLRMLHLSETGPLDPVVDYFKFHPFPKLSHLRISGTGESEFQLDLRAYENMEMLMTIACIIGVIPEPEKEKFASDRGLSVPRMDQHPPGHIFVIESTLDTAKFIHRELKAEPDIFAGRHRPFVLLVTPNYLLPHETNQRIRAEWFARLESQEGCWRSVFNGLDGDDPLHEG